MKEKSQNSEIQTLVLEKAAGLIASRGPKGWSTAELAKKCGLAKNTLYKIIGSKEQLVEKVVLEQIDATTTILRHIIESSDGYQSAARRMLKEGPPFLARRPRVTFAEIFLEYPAIEGKALAHQKKAAAAIIEFIRQGQAEGHIRSDIEPEFIYNLHQGVTDHYVRSGLTGESLSEVLTKAFTCLREGIRLGDW